MCMDRMLNVNMMSGLVCLTEMIKQIFCRSFDPLLRLRTVLSEFSESNQLEILRVCIDPFEAAEALSKCSVCGLL